MRSSVHHALVGLVCLVLPGFLVSARAGAPSARPVVYLARGLGDAELISLGVTVANEPGAVLLLDSDQPLPALSAYLKEARPARVLPIGRFSEGSEELQRRLGVPVAAPRLWSSGIPGPTPHSPLSTPHFPSVVVCPASPRTALLQAACLAGLEKAALWVVEGQASEASSVRRALRRVGCQHVTLVGSACDFRIDRSVGALRLPDEGATARACLRRIEATGPLTTAIVCNPADEQPGKPGLSALGPWLAIRKRALLLLTAKNGRNLAQVVRPVATPARRRFDTLVLLADLQAIPVEQRPNPIPDGKDPHIHLEPLTPAGKTPFSWAIGRLFHQDRAVVPLLLARQALLLHSTGPRRALVASNPGGGLELLETLSRTTARELENAGYTLTARFGHSLTASVLREALPRADVFLWEGHHNTLVKDWGFTRWEEPLPATFVFLQSCLALQEEKAGPLLERGAVAVVGTSTRTWSGSGGAFSLSFFDALIHDHRSAGASLRQAKNFLIAYALLKEKRLGPAAQRTGANLRAAWAFSLWGDPTLELPAPPAPEDQRPAARHEVTGRTLTLHLPEQSLGQVKTEKYHARVQPNVHLAGLVAKTEERKYPHRLVPLVFAEVELPRFRPGNVPRLSSRLPSSRWVFTWDERRQVGYLLVLPRPDEGPTIRFQIHGPLRKDEG